MLSTHPLERTSESTRRGETTSNGTRAFGSAANSNSADKSANFRSRWRRAPSRSPAQATLFLWRHLPAQRRIVGGSGLDDLQRRLDGQHRAIRRRGALQQEIDHRAGVATLAVGVIAPFGCERPVLDRLASLAVLSPSGRIDEDLAGKPGVLDGVTGADRVDVPVAEDGAQVRILLQHCDGDLSRLLGLPVRRLVGDDLDLRVLLEHLERGLVHHHAVGCGELPGNDRHLAGFAAAGAAFLDDVLRDLRTDARPIGADEGGGRLVGLQVDLQNLDAGGLRLLDLPCEQLDRRIVDDQNVRLIADRLGQQLRHRACIEGGVADLEAVAVHRSVLSHPPGPALGERDAHRDGHEDDLLPGHLGGRIRVSAGAERDAGAERQSGDRCMQLASNPQHQFLPRLHRFSQITDRVGLRVSRVEIVVDENRRDEHDAPQHVLDLSAEVVKRHAVAQDRDQGGADQKIAHAAASASQRNTAEHHHQDDFEQQAPVRDDAEIDRPARGGDHEAGDERGQRGVDVDKNRRCSHGQTGKAGGQEIVAHGVDDAPCRGEAQQEPGEDQRRDHERDGSGQAGQKVGLEKEDRRVRFRQDQEKLAAQDGEAKEARDQHGGGQSREQGRDFDKGDEPAVHKPDHRHREDGEDDRERSRKACVDQRAVRRRASHHRRDLRQVEATGNDHDRHAAAQKDERRRVGENDRKISNRRKTGDGQGEQNDQPERDGQDDRLEQAASRPPRQSNRRGCRRVRHGIHLVGALGLKNSRASAGLAMSSESSSRILRILSTCAAHEVASSPRLRNRLSSSPTRTWPPMMAPIATSDI